MDLNGHEIIQGVIKSHISKDRQYNCQKKNNNGLQKSTQKTKERATQTPLKSDVNSGVPAPHVAPVV